MNAAERTIYISRELSWLNFNSRVLDEAFCGANPLLERFKFLAIFSGNLDEFFMVRVAGLRQLSKIGQDTPDPSGLRPVRHLEKIRRKIDRLLGRARSCLENELLPELEKNGVALREVAQLSEAERQRLRHFFELQILPVLTPLAVDQAHPFPIVNNGAIEIAVSMIPEGGTETVYAFVEVPEVLPRFIAAGSDGGKKVFVLLEDLVMNNLQQLFSGCLISGFFPFRITRDMDFAVESDGVEDLLHSIEKKILQRRQREPIRLEMPRRCCGVVSGPEQPLALWLRSQFNLDGEFCYFQEGMLYCKQLFELVAKVNDGSLLEPPWPPLLPEVFRSADSIFDILDRSSPQLLALPFHSFSPVLRLLEEAADDPDVLAIKQTLYRVSGNSPVVRALQRAAANGKQVTVIVELKARFDEGNNIQWARRLEESGAHVVYGISGLKIHCKALLVVRKEEGAIRRYVHLSTGNYNDKTATLYTDMGLITCDPDLAFDVATLFNVMTGYSSVPENWRKLAVAPFDLRQRLSGLIGREKALAERGRPGYILAKMNSLSDPDMIKLLHEAVGAGVRVDLIVRGICCLKPDPGLKNLRIISIVDRYLEHTRVFCFGNDGEPEYFLASADFMIRNLDRRIELMFPVEDSRLRRILRDILELQLADEEKARHLQASGRYTNSRLPSEHRACRSQHRTYEYFRRLESEAAGSAGLVVHTAKTPTEGKQ